MPQRERFNRQPPPRPEAAIDDASRLLQAGEAQKAERILRKLLKADPNNADGLHLAGVARHRAGKIAQARDLVERAISAEPGVSDYHVTLGGILDQEEKIEPAVAAYERAIALDPTDADTCFRLANGLKLLGRLDEAIERYLYTLKLAPGSAPALYNYGNTLRQLGRLDEAIGVYRQILERNPEFVPVYVNLGNALIRSGQVDEAFAIVLEGARRKFAAIDLDEETLRRPVETSSAKLLHDAEQIDYLIARGKVSGKYADAAAVYRRLIDAAPETQSLTHSYPMPMDERRAVATSYNRMFHLNDAPRIEGPAVNPGLDIDRIERDYHAKRPEIVYFDDFLTEEALTRIRDFCLESTIWYTHYDGGYLGALLGDGFASPLLAQIVDELPKALPGIFGGHPLRQAWAFKYDSRLSGINMHADFAAVNVNFWITPDDAVEEEGTGGLVVWDKEAPLDWDFEKFNNDQDAMRRYLKENNANAERIPYRQNRALIFNSDLFHETDRIAFRPGYENRRINITLLYGDRDKA